MRIIQQTPTYLKLQENRLPAQLWKVAVGLPFVLSGIASMVIMGERSVLTCDRTTPRDVQCQISTHTLFKTTHTPIPSVQGAEVVTRPNSQGDTFRVSLLTDAQPIPLSQSWSPNEEGQQIQADIITVFLQDPSQPTLRLEQDARWYAYPLGLLFVGLGGFIMATGWRPGEPDFCTFDKRSKQIQWRRTLTGGAQRRDLTFQDLEEVRVFRTKDGEGSDRPYTTRLILQSGEMLPLLSGHDQEQQRQLASTLNRFLGVDPRRKQI